MVYAKMRSLLTGPKMVGLIMARLTTVTGLEVYAPAIEEGGRVVIDIPYNLTVQQVDITNKNGDLVWGFDFHGEVQKGGTMSATKRFTWSRS